MFVLLVIAVIMAWRKSRAAASAAWSFLLIFTVPLWGFYFVMNLWKGTEVNWPAASYFTGMILLAGIFVDGWNSADAKLRRDWRGWGTVAIAWGVLLTAFALNTHRFYPWAASKLEPIAGTPDYFKSAWNPRKWDQPMSGKVKGMAARAAAVEPLREAMAKADGRDPMIIGRRYGASSSLAFYLPGQPFVYCIMSAAGDRQSQYDLWPGLNERDTGGELVHKGESALIVATDFDKTTLDLLKKSFDEVMEIPTAATGTQPAGTLPYVELPVVVEGVAIRQVVVYRARGFHGLPETTAGTVY
jgi:hypothetical protein